MVHLDKEYQIIHSMSEQRGIQIDSSLDNKYMLYSLVTTLPYFNLVLQFGFFRKIKLDTIFIN